LFARACVLRRPMIRILLVDDHPVVRHGLRTMLTDRVKGSVIGEARDAEEALAQVTASPWGCCDR
jgi:DNA-binding NarL/FixJ family response regulator